MKKELIHISMCWLISSVCMGLLSATSVAGTSLSSSVIASVDIITPVSVTCTPEPGSIAPTDVSGVMGAGRLLTQFSCDISAYAKPDVGNLEWFIIPVSGTWEMRKTGDESQKIAVVVVNDNNNAGQEINGGRVYTPNDKEAGHFSVVSSGNQNVVPGKYTLELILAGNIP